MFGRYSPQVSTLPKDNQTPPFLRTASGVGSARKTLPADLEDDSFIPPFLRSSHTYDDSCDYGSGPAVFDDLPPTRSRYSPEVDDDDMSGSFTSRLAGPSSPLSAGISATASNRSIAAMDVGGFDQAGPYDLLRCTDDAPDPVSTFFPKTGHSTFDFNYGRVHRPFPEASQPKDDAAQRAGWMRQAKKKSDVMDEVGSCVGIAIFYKCHL
ncbi:hypothetical protein BC832DRAFT_244400 [Gaertneriomyces semiglobifer]|nr:hypothetical protein BC832DRAFT_244400 [Gaertneriomyces semiglobifer]